PLGLSIRRGPLTRIASRSDLSPAGRGSAPCLREKDGEDYRFKTVATIVENDQDKHVGKCNMPK
ncbi:MAG: hypothetical protein QOF91_1603, partial [Alphaproteobacteria bacterium]|nr:hypothetical protein [Alphaproteobacteria bacterium]